MKKTAMLLLPLLAGLGSVVGCSGVGDDTGELGSDGEVTDIAPGQLMDSDGSGDAREIARVHIPAVDTTLTFHRSDDDDSVIVHEDAPTGAPSVLEATAVAEEATPLEVFLSLLPKTVEVPEPLLRNHERLTEATEQREPRLLDVRAFEGANLANVGESPLGSSSQALTSDTAADCSFSADGQSYFDGIWQALGWGWHWYRYSSQSQGVGELAAPMTPATGAYRSHVCNGGREGYPLATARHRVMRLYTLPPTIDGKVCNEQQLLDFAVPRGRRSLVSVSTTDRVCKYQSFIRANGTVGFPFRSAIGVMAPP